MFFSQVSFLGMKDGLTASMASQGTLCDTPRGSLASSPAPAAAAAAAGGGGGPPEASVIRAAAAAAATAKEKDGCGLFKF